MAGFQETLGNVFSGSTSMIWIVISIVVIGGIGIFLLLIGLSYWYFKKRWNLRVEIKLPRSDGGISIGEWGKGMFDTKKGVLFIKREGYKFSSAAVKVFDIKKYLQGSDLLTVIQVGPEDYRPVLNDSWTKHVVDYVNNETGETRQVKESIMNIKIDTGLNKAWKSAWDNAAKRAYSLSTFFTQFQTPIAIGIVIVSCFVGFSILWIRIGGG